MTTKQTIKNVSAANSISQISNGGGENVTQAIEDADSGAQINQRSESNSLRIGKAKASGLVSVVLLGLMAALYIVYM